MPHELHVALLIIVTAMWTLSAFGLLWSLWTDDGQRGPNMILATFVLSVILAILAFN